MFLPIIHQPPMYLNAAWSGPEIRVEGRVLTQASATFRVPKASAKGTNAATMAYWVGLGDHAKQVDLCQAGVANTRVNGTFQTGLIAQDYPAPPVVDTGVVAMGDLIHVTVGDVAGHYAATVTDLTTGHSLTVGCRVPAQGAWRKAEWIAEEQAAQPVLTSAPLVWKAMQIVTKRPVAYQWIDQWAADAIIHTGRWGHAVIRFY